MSGPFRTWLAAALLCVSAAANGCASRDFDVRQRASQREESAAQVVWLGPTAVGDTADLARWRRSVGPPIVMAGATSTAAGDRLVIVNWNTHVGGGDLARLFSEVRRQFGEGTPMVLLLQEAYRSGPEVPTALEPGSTFASLIKSLRHDGKREDIDTMAAALGLHAYYVPSMRNGAPGISDEDRGNAILSTVPLTDLAAIELPFEAQRRVAVAATLHGTTRDGRPWQVRVVSAHLDNMGGARRLWFAGGEYGRARQAQGLVNALSGSEPLVLGADMNTWFGFHDSAYAAAARAFPATTVSDRRATFRGLLRLDHLFFRLGDGWRASFRRLDDRYDSDHYPLVGTIDFPTARASAQ